MNKLKKSAFTTAIVFLLSLSMATTVFASRQSEFAEWKSFPVQKSTSYSSSYTKAMQLLLQDAGTDASRRHISMSGGVDGKFGPGTVKALKAYQSARGLAVDGSCGPNTWFRLYSELNYDSRYYTYVSNSGYYYTYQTYNLNKVYVIRRGAASGSWLYRSSGSVGTLNPNEGSYTTFR